MDCITRVQVNAIRLASLGLHKISKVGYVPNAMIPVSSVLRDNTTYAKSVYPKKGTI